MLNNKQKSQSSQPKHNETSDKLYIRQPDGTKYEAVYTKQAKVREILQKIYPNTLLSQIQLISKGRLINLDQTVNENSLNPGQILHILKKQSNQSQRNHYIAYVSFQQKLYKIQYEDENCLVIGFKQNIERETKVSIDRQIVKYRGVVLDNQKSLKEYSVQNQDIFTMEKLDRNQMKKTNNLVNQNINAFLPKLNIKSRRGSDGVILSNQSINSQNLVSNPTITINKLTTSEVNLNFDKLRPHKFTIKTNNNNNILSPSIIYGPSSSQLSQEDPEANFELEQGQWNLVKSQQGSPLIKYIHDIHKNINNNEEVIKEVKQECFENSMKQFGNIFGGFPRNNHEEVNPLQFNIEKDQNTNQNEGNLLFKSNKDSLDLQDAFNNLIAAGGEQEVVFCSSYYQKQQDKNQQKTNDLKKNQSRKSGKDKNQSELENAEQYPRSPKKQATKISSIQNIIHLSQSEQIQTSQYNKNVQQIFNKIAKS